MLSGQVVLSSARSVYQGDSGDPVAAFDSGKGVIRSRYSFPDRFTAHVQFTRDRRLRLRPAAEQRDHPVPRRELRLEVLHERSVLPVDLDPVAVEYDFQAKHGTGRSRVRLRLNSATSTERVSGLSLARLMNQVARAWLCQKIDPNGR